MEKRTFTKEEKLKIIQEVNKNPKQNEEKNKK